MSRLVLILGWACVASAFADEPTLIIDTQGHLGVIRKVLFTRDGQKLISVSEDKTIRMWDVAHGDPLKSIRGQIGDGAEGMLYAAALSPDDKILAVAGYGYGTDKNRRQYITLVDLESEQRTASQIELSSSVKDLAFSHNGRFLASCSEDSKVRVWEVSQIGGPSAKLLQPIATLSEHTNIVNGVVFSPDDTKLVTASADNILRLWEIERADGQPVFSHRIVMKKHTAAVRSVAYSPDGKYIVSGGADRRLLLWNGQGEFIKEIDKTVFEVYTISFSLDSKKIVISCGLGWGTAVYSIPDAAKISSFMEHDNTVLASAFYGNDLVATAGGDDNEIYIWDADSGAIKTHMVGKGKQVWAIAFGAGLNLAFGNRKKYLADPIGFPLEKSFNFADFSISLQKPSVNDFRRTLTEHNGKRLESVSKFELNVQGSGRIKNEESDGQIHSYTFTQDGDIIVGNSFSLKLYRSNGNLVRNFIGHTGGVRAVSLSRDGQLLVSASSDQTIKLWNLKTGELLSTLFVASDNEWVCWTPQGYYAASAGGEKYIGWHINQGVDKNALFYPVSTFRQQYFNPELVKRTIELGTFAGAFAEFNANTGKKVEQKAVTQLLPPQVEWLLPADYRTETSSDTISLKVNLVSDTIITQVKWLRNGRPFVTERRPDLAPQLRHTLVEEAVLNEGENEFAIFAANDNATTTSDKRVVVYHKDSTQSIVPADRSKLEEGDRGIQPIKPDRIEDWQKPNLYLVAIGISSYQISNLSLNYADDDARAMSQIFKTQIDKLYKTVNIKELYDTTATRANILRALEWVDSSATKKDVAIVFVAAHGVNDKKGNFYVLPSDGDPNSLSITAVDCGDFRKTLGSLPSRVLLFLDTCHSGQLGKNMLGLRGIADNTEAIRELASDEYGLVIMAASTGKESSQERNEWQHGAFTQALLEGLKNGLADYTKDGTIHVDELETFVSEKVNELTQGVQKPTTLIPSTISRWPIFRTK